LWNSKDLTKVATLTGHRGSVTCLDFSTDGKWLVSGSRDKSVIIWDVGKKELFKLLKEDAWQGIYDANFNSDASKLGVTTWTFHKGKVFGIVHLFETQNWELVTKLEPPSPHPVSAIDFSDNGEGVVYGTWGLSIHYYDFIQRNVKWALNMMENYEYSSVTSIEVSPDNSLVLLGTKDTKVRLIDIKSGDIKFESSPYEWHGHEVNDVTFSPSGVYFASSSIDQSINIGQTSSGLKASTLLGHRASVNEIVYHPGGLKLYSVASDGYLNTWDLKSKQLNVFRGCPEPGYGSGMSSAKVDPTGKRLAMACGAQVMIWDLPQGKSFKLDAPTYYGLEFIGDSQLVVGERDGKVSVWDIPSQRMLQRFAVHDDYIQKAISLENSRVLTSSGKLLKLWDLKNGSQIKSFEAASHIASFEASRANNAVILCLSGGSNVVLDLKSFEIKYEWKSTSTGSRIELSPDENRFAIGQSNGTIVAYETKSNSQLAQFSDSEGSIASMSFDKSGNYIVTSTSGNTHTLKFWSVLANTMTLSMHEYPDIYAISRLGNERGFMLADKHGMVYVIRY
jgi:WD40 repeat protein